MCIRLLVLATAVATSSPLMAQRLPANPPVDSVRLQPDQHRTDAVARFADGFFPQEMARRHIPGLVFVFVSSGEIAIARGFGAAQLEPRRPVDAERTVFRLASVSKTITATAALQLVERGRLDLHKDVNTYLKHFQLAAGHGPITLHHLLTHTAGFDERLTGMAARSAQDMQPLADYLAKSMPPMFIEPGRVNSYSNHGFALIGLLVQEASGRPFADYVQEEILKPLGMHRSGFLTARVPADLAVAYDFVDGQHHPLSPEYVQVSPSGAFFTTGTDMGHFLIAHLRGGTYHDRRVLRQETVARMHAQQFAQTPDVSGWAYGLWEDARNGGRALLHNGGGKGYRALLYLLPEQDAGFFLAYNLADKHADGELQELFIQRYRQAFVPARDQASHAYEHRSVDQFVGDYQYVRRARTTMEKMIAAVNSVHIERREKGALRMTGPSREPVGLTAIGPLLFRRDDGRGVVAFDAVEAGRARRVILVTESGFPAVYDRIPALATLRVQVSWLLAMTAMFVYAGVWRPLAAVARRRTNISRMDSTWAVTWRLEGVASALNLIFLIAFPLVFLGRIEGGIPAFVYGVPEPATLLLLIPPTTALMGIATALLTVRIWWNRQSPLRVRLEHTLISTALVAFAGFACYWHVM
jgi:CubicO group peptidase (beta-lactamase class C family)